MFKHNRILIRCILMLSLCFFFVITPLKKQQTLAEESSQTEERASRRRLVKDVIEEDFKRGNIDYETALIQKVYSLFAPEKLLPKYQQYRFIQADALKFESQDFIDPSSLVSKLRDAKNGTSEYILRRFSEQTRQLLKEYNDQEEISLELINASGRRV